jgi:transcriptional regulator with XRE-family HTH domain
MTESDSLVVSSTHLRETLGRNVRQQRLALKMSQRDLAEGAGVRQALVSEIERAEANPTLDSIMRIATALETDFTELFEWRRS